ncbi:MAG: hypothetical protein DMD62_05150 [Gemmatimonadetes bacterium]|nr:MAG: hypothetical protein DMD62_05150 [Gemmatimonadota bacterium]
MTAPATAARSDFTHILISGTIVGAATAFLVIVFLLVSRNLPTGMLTSLLLAVIVLAGGVVAAFLPASFASARAVQGIASAAAIGLWGTVVFMAIDIILLRPFKAYPWTWDAVGGGSTWWYLPIWWMLGTFLSWTGALVTAGRAGRGGNTAIRSVAIAPLAVGLIVALGLGLRHVIAMPVAAGLGFAVTVFSFALIGLLRRG